MAYFQTCRRHPQAGRFLATCCGCAQELYDIEQRNRALAAAPKALAVIDTPANARIIDATWVGDALIVSTEQPGYFRYAVDSFRLPTAAEVDPDQTDPRTPGQWILIDQYGDDSEAAVPGMVAQASAYARSLRPVAA